jgi:hypothetical protein
VFDQPESREFRLCLSKTVDSGKKGEGSGKGDISQDHQKTYLNFLSDI